MQREHNLACQNAGSPVHNLQVLGSDADVDDDDADADDPGALRASTATTTTSLRIGG